LIFKKTQYISTDFRFWILVLEIPLHIRKTEQVVMRDLQTVLRLVDLGKVSSSDKTFYPTGALTANKFAPILPP